MENSGYNSVLAGSAQGTTPSWNSGTGVPNISRTQSSAMSNSASLSHHSLSNTNRTLPHPGIFRPSTLTNEVYFAPEIDG